MYDGMMVTDCIISLKPTLHFNNNKNNCSIFELYIVFVTLSGEMVYLKFSNLHALLFSDF